MICKRLLLGTSMLLFFMATKSNSAPTLMGKKLNRSKRSPHQPPPGTLNFMNTQEGNQNQLGLISPTYVRNIGLSTRTLENLLFYLIFPSLMIGLEKGFVRVIEEVLDIPPEKSTQGPVQPPNQGNVGLSTRTIELQLLNKIISYLLDGMLKGFVRAIKKVKNIPPETFTQGPVQPPNQGNVGLSTRTIELQFLEKIIPYIIRGFAEGFVMATEDITSIPPEKSTQGPVQPPNQGNVGLSIRTIELQLLEKIIPYFIRGFAEGLVMATEDITNIFPEKSTQGPVEPPNQGVNANPELGFNPPANIMNPIGQSMNDQVHSRPKSRFFNK